MSSGLSEERFDSGSGLSFDSRSLGALRSSFGFDDEAADDAEMFLNAWRDHVNGQIQSYRANLSENKKTPGRSSSMQRSLCRMAEGLVQTKPSRVCVAIVPQKARGIRGGYVLHVFANKVDGDIANDAWNSLDPSSRRDVEKSMVEGMVANKARFKKEGVSRDQAKAAAAPQAKKNARRRLRKVRQDFSAIVTDIKIRQNKSTCALHAEMAFVDSVWNLARGKKVFIGISKLCCAKCYLALVAYNSVFGHTYGEINFQGGHFQPYDKWFAPKFLNEKKVLKLFLGKKAYEIYKSNRIQVAQWIAMGVPRKIEGRTKEMMNQLYYSSEESAEESSEEEPMSPKRRIRHVDPPGLKTKKARPRGSSEADSRSDG